MVLYVCVAYSGLFHDVKLGDVQQLREYPTYIMRWTGIIMYVISMTSVLYTITAFSAVGALTMFANQQEKKRKVARRVRPQLQPFNGQSWAPGSQWPVPGSQPSAPPMESSAQHSPQAANGSAMPPSLPQPDSAGHTQLQRNMLLYATGPRKSKQQQRQKNYSNAPNSFKPLKRVTSVPELSKMPPSLYPDLAAALTDQSASAVAAADTSTVTVTVAQIHHQTREAETRADNAEVGGGATNKLVTRTQRGPTLSSQPDLQKITTIPVACGTLACEPVMTQDEHDPAPTADDSSATNTQTDREEQSHDDVVIASEKTESRHSKDVIMVDVPAELVDVPNNDQQDSEQHNSEPYDSEQHGSEQHDSEQHGSEQHDSKQHDSKQHDSEQHDSKQHDSKQHDSEKHDNKQHDNDQHDNEQHDSEQHDSDKHDSKQHDSDQHDSKQHDSDQHNSKQHNSKQHDSDKHNSKQHDSEQHDHDQYHSAQHDTTTKRVNKIVPDAQLKDIKATTASRQHDVISSLDVNDINTNTEAEELGCGAGASNGGEQCGMTSTRM